MRRVLVGLVALVMLFGLFVGGVALLDYTESTEFCTLCHRTMEPEAVTHQVTAHADVDCGTCHIGEGILWSIYYHVTNARYAVTYPFGLYERPLETPRSTLRPADDVCGQCHWEEAHYQPRLVTLSQYAADEANTQTQVQFLLKTGGGWADLPGVGIGAHWHVANPVSYLATDEKAQEIPWVRAVVDGEVREYSASGADLTPQAVAAADMGELDCMDCHSRAQHRIPPTEEAVDRAMAEGLLPADLPYIKSVAMDVLEQRYETREAGYAAMDAVSDRYQSQYPAVYSSRQEDVERAVEGLRLLFSRTHFPYMNQYWDSYPDNVGHTYFPGCFRCHDGDHLAEDGQAIRAECNLCHSIPQVASGGALLPAVSLAFAERPESHESSLWIAEHRYRFDTSCADCHTIENPGGADDTSFCSNSACHGREWEYLALDTERVLGLVVPAREPAEVARPVPHFVVERMDCELCHGLGLVLAYPEDHATYTRDLCTACHPVPEAEEEATPEPTPVETPVEVVTPTVEPTATVPVEVTPEATITVTPEVAVTHTPSATETPAAEETGTPEVAETPTAEETPVVEGTSVPGEAVSLQPPPIPHGLEGREECLACHAVDSPIQPAPEHHVDFTEDQCQTCHKLGVEGPPEPEVPESVTTDLCLFCHGPYDVLRSATEGYQVSEEVTANPHQYVPHESEDPGDIPVCDRCHDPHALPVTGEVEFEDPGIRWCFAACHHTGTLNPCSDCH